MTRQKKASEPATELGWLLKFDIRESDHAFSKDISVGDAGAATVDLTLGRDAMALDYSENESGWRLVLEHRTGRRWFINRTDNRVIESDIGIDGVTQLLAGVPTAKANVTGAERTLLTADVDHTSTHLTFDFPAAIVEVWAVSLKGLSRTTERLAWLVLTGFQLDTSNTFYGIPVEVVVRHKTDLARQALRMNVKAIARHHTSNIDVTGLTKTVRNQSVEFTVRPRKPIQRRQSLRRSMLFAEAPNTIVGDVAWLPRQALLDRFRTIVNKVTAAFGDYSGTHGGSDPGLHLDEIDWWKTIYDHLQPHGQEMVDGLVGLSLFPRAIKEERIESMTDDERRIYESVIAAAHSEASQALLNGKSEEEAEAARIFHISTQLMADFGDQAWMDLAYRETAQDRKPFKFAPTNDNNEPLKEIEGTVDSVSMRYKLDNLDLTISMGNRANLDRLEFNDGALSVGFTLDRIVVDFRFRSWQEFNADGLAFTKDGIKALGGKIAGTVVDFNIGVGRLTINSPTITVDLQSTKPWDEPQPRGIGLKSSYNRDLSHMEATLTLWGVNLAADLIINIGTRIGHDLEKALGEGFGKAIEEALNKMDFASYWPDAWNAEKGPELSPSLRTRSTLTFVDEGACLQGWLAQPMRAGDAVPMDRADVTRAAFSGVALSRDYLAAWLRAWMTTKDRDPAKRMELDAFGLEQAVGVQLPRQQPRPDPELPEAVPERHHYIRIGGELVEVYQSNVFKSGIRGIEVSPAFYADRSIDVVVPQGVSNVAGTARIDYFIQLTLTKYMTRSRPQYPDLGDPGGAHEDPVGGLDGGRNHSSGAAASGNAYIAVESERLQQYLDALVRVEIPIVFGLEASVGNPVLLPTLTLALAEPDAQAAVSFPHVYGTDPLSDTPALREYLEQVVRRDAEGLFAPLRASVPSVRRELIPLSPYAEQANPNLNDDLIQLVVIRQVGSNSQDDPFVYEGSGRWVYWNWDWVDQLDSWFPS